MLFAIFGLGWAELVVLGILCFVPVIVLVVVLAVVAFMAKKKPPARKAPEEEHDIGGEG